MNPSQLASVDTMFAVLWRQAKAESGSLMASVHKADFFNDFLGTQQAKQMADQAYAQYNDYNRRASNTRNSMRSGRTATTACDPRVALVNTICLKKGN